MKRDGVFIGNSPFILAEDVIENRRGKKAVAHTLVGGNSVVFLLASSLVSPHLYCE